MEPWIEYDLPAELVAQEPLQNRADARLMVSRVEVVEKKAVIFIKVSTGPADTNRYIAVVPFGEFVC